MRELERERFRNPRAPTALTIVGPGRVGRAVAAAAAGAGIETSLLGRDLSRERDSAPEAALLCVPDSAIGDACESVIALMPGLRLVGHTSGATSLEALGAATAEGISTFSIHPLQTVRGDASDLDGAPCAVSGSDTAALEFAERLSSALGMTPFEVPDHDRAAYHAAASIASNFLVTLEESAAGLLGGLGVADARRLLAPLVLRTAANWAEDGAGALTGPIARGDEQTVERHLAALAEADPGLLDLYRALAERTRELAQRTSREVVG